MSAWNVKRKEPYTVRGIARLKCIRCGAKSVHQWQICADGNNFRPLCLECDISLNSIVLNWMRHPKHTIVLKAYEARQTRKVA